MAESITIISVNAGSSSIKAGVFECNPESGTAALLAESTQILGHGGYSAALGAIFDWLDLTTTGKTPAGIGHRVVHGGPDNIGPVIITDRFEQKLEELVPFDPIHMPVAIECIDAFRRRFPNVPQVACFDTAFFHDLPRVAQIVPLPRKYEKLGLRRYGFHGLSYSYLLSKFEDVCGSQAAHGRIIFAHLGSGVSLTAVKNGQPLDTTMSFTSASGVMMSTRSGDLDPGIAWYLQQQAGVDAEAYNKMITSESGLLGVSELSPDMYELLEAASTNTQAAEAVQVFCYQVKKTIGSLAAVLGGLDSLVFSGGMGEASSPIRARICDGLQFLGIELSETANDTHALTISADGSRVGVHVIPTDENIVIARQVAQTIQRTEPKELTQS